jgi:hypothetical protein
MHHVRIPSMCIFFAVLSGLLLAGALKLPAESSSNRLTELREEQIRVYSEIFEMAKKTENSGEGSREDVIKAYLAYTDARLSSATSREERLNLLDERVTVHGEFEELQKQRFKEFTVSKIEYLEAVAERIGAEIDLASEQQKK